MIVEVITRDGCAACAKVKQILENHSVPYHEVRIGVDVTREEIVERYPNIKKLPIIHVGENHVEGAAELTLLLERNQLGLLNG